MTTGVRYLPWCRRAGAVDGLTVRAAGRDIAVAVSNHGPGDVIGLDAAQVVRREPASGSSGFQPNLFPFVEFRAADLPWQLSPGAPDGAGRLTPWLALVVREAPDGAPPSRRRGPLPVIEVPAAELPRFDELALWCHVQVTGDLAAPPASLLGGGVARLIAPRALRPRTRYLACLVPCFEAGRRAGLGDDVPDPRSAQPAWGDSGDVLLPVYDHWLFTTADAGDFETLGRRIQPSPIEAADPPWRLDAAAITGPDGAVTTFMTALVPVSWTETWDAGARARGAARLDGWLAQAAAATEAAPMIGPPLYGGFPARTNAVAPGWLADLNLDPRRRAAAALGAEVVRREQEELVAEAWRQLGHVRRANRERDLVQLGTAVVARWSARHVRALAPAAQLSLGAPMLARLRRGTGSLATEVDASALPRTLLSAPLRRLAAVHARASATQQVEAVARTGARTVPIGARPPSPPALATATKARALIRHLPDVTGPAGGGVLGTRPRPPLAAPRVRHVVIASGIGRLRARVLRTLEVARPPVLALPSVSAAVAGALGDVTVLARRHGARLDVGQIVTAVSMTAPLVGEPEIGHPLADHLRGLDTRYLAAGVVIDPDSVGLLTPNGPFIESVLIGANHELVNELRWRGAAVDGRATLLRRFFDVRGRRTEAPTDIGPVAGWSRSTALGSHLRNLGQSVIVFRGELIRRFADPIIYGARAIVLPRGRFPSDEPADQLDPMFRGVLTDDTIFAGFARTPAQLRDENEHGWFVVLAERPTGPHFGLDEAAATPVALASWNDLSWDHVTVARGHVHVGGRNLAVPGPGAPVWGRDAAHMASITMQRPVFFAFHVRDLLPPEPA